MVTKYYIYLSKPSVKPLRLYAMGGSHINLDTCEPFYIGKGLGRRFSQYNNVISKHGCISN